MQRTTLVLKFGGTSVRDYEAMSQVVKIVDMRTSVPVIVVVSAVAGITDSLAQIFQAIEEGNEQKAQTHMKQILTIHTNIYSRIKKQDATLDQQYQKIGAQFEACVKGLLARSQLLPEDKDELLAFGELFSSTLLALVFKENHLSTQWLDIRHFIKTEAQFGAALPLYQTTYERMSKNLVPMLKPGRVIVTQGFIGQTLEGKTTTLGRGGSDFTASILAAGLEARWLEIWTDVDGIMTADPRMVKNARKINEVTFSEAAELAYFGAKVLHPATLLPAMGKNIPVIVRNTMKPHQPGTIIYQDEAMNRFVGATSVAFKKGITVMNITSARMLMAWGFLYRVFEIFYRFKTPVDLVSTSEVSISLTIDDDTHLEEICAELSQIGQVEVFRNQALICLVGRGMRSTPGIAARLFKAILPVNVRMISQGASEINISFIIAEEDLPYAVQRIHEEFFEKEFQPVKGKAS